MSTLTCSTFLPRNCLASYLDGKYLLAANGPFLELFDLDTARNEDYDLSKSVVVKTRVTKNSSICHILPLEKSGNIVVITRDFRRKCLKLTAHVIHRDRILNGGYEMNPSTSHVLRREDNFNKDESYGDTIAKVIPNEDEFILLTSRFIARYRFSFSSSDHLLDANISREEFFDLKPLLEEHAKPPHNFVPRFVAPFVPFNFILKSSTGDENNKSLLLFIHIDGKRSTFGEYKVGESSRELIVPSHEIGVICDHEDITIVQTGTHQQKERSKELKELFRYPIPHDLPKRIFAAEESEREIAIFIVSDNGISKSIWDGKELKFPVSVDFVGKDVSSICGSSTEENVVPQPTKIRHANHPEIEDGIIISDRTTNADDVVTSHKTGSITFMPLVNKQIEVNLNGPSILHNKISSPTLRSSDVFVLRHKEDGSKFSSNVVAVNSQGVEIMVMNSQGSISRRIYSCEKESHEHIVRDRKMSVPCSDVKFEPVNNSAYILMGALTKEFKHEMHKVYVKIIDDMTVSKAILPLTIEGSPICSVCYFHNEFTKSPDCFAVLTTSTLRVYYTNYKEITTPIFEVLLSSSSKRKDCNMLTMGDGLIVHDVWLLSDSKVSLFIGRNREYKKKTVELQFPNWKGSITASCSLSTKTSVNEDYLDIIFIAKGPKMGILVALHMDDDPANVIQFTEWKMPKGSDAVGIHTELLKYEVKNDIHILDVRLYAIKKKSGTLHISVCRLIVDGSGVAVSKQSPSSKFTIHSSVRNPHQIAVTNMHRIDAKPNIDPPKYVIISGSNGSQVVRICPKKQLNSKDLDKISSSSSADQEIVSDVEE